MTDAPIASLPVLAIAELVCCTPAARYDLLYAALLRLLRTPRLFEISSDLSLVRRLEDIDALRRDRHR